MFRSVALAFCILLSLLFLGCGGGNPGIVTGGNNGGIQSALVVPYCEGPPCMNVIWSRTGSDNPIMEGTIWASDCSRDPVNQSPINGAKQDVRELNDLEKPIEISTPTSVEYVNYFGRMTYMDKENNQREYFGNTGCIKNARSPNTDVRLEMAQIR